jgi:RNA 3'-terminal phosphate cyclase (ATP)
MTGHIVIDGSQGEGGGQMVRSSLALSILTGKPVTIEKMRAGRDKPGLMPQHLTAVHAAAQICGADVRGAAVGASTLHFDPRPVKPGEYRFSVGTAGSATLVLQTVLPPLLVANASSKLVLEGGTHNPWAPPFEFLQRAYLPLVNRMGPRVTAELERHGFYPAGGGRMVVSIDPQPILRGFDLLERGEIVGRSLQAIIANLPEHIALREVERIIQELGWNPDSGRTARVEALGPGNAVWAEIESEHVTEVFASFGRLGVRAEQVGEEVARQVQSYLSTRAAIGPFLADQLLLPLSISAWQAAQSRAHGGGSFRTLPLTGHATTHIEILVQFLGIHVQSSADDSTCQVSISAYPNS